MFSCVLLRLQDIAAIGQDLADLAARKREIEGHAKRIKDGIARVDERARAEQARCGCCVGWVGGGKVVVTAAALALLALVGAVGRV